MLGVVISLFGMVLVALSGQNYLYLMSQLSGIVYALSVLSSDPSCHLGLCLILC